MPKIPSFRVGDAAAARTASSSSARSDTPSKLGSAPYERDLAALAHAARSSPQEFEARAVALIGRYDVEHAVNDLWGRALLAPGRTQAFAGADGHRSGTGYSVPGYRLYSSASTPWKIDEYLQRLGGMADAVARGELAEADARRRAARPLRSELSGLFFGAQNSMEIANLTERKGILASTGSAYETKAPRTRLALMSLDDFQPDAFTHFKASWTNLEGSVVIDFEKQSVSADPLARSKGQETLLRFLKYLGEVAKAQAASPQ